MTNNQFRFEPETAVHKVQLKIKTIYRGGRYDV